MNKNLSICAVALMLALSPRVHADDKELPVELFAGKSFFGLGIDQKNVEMEADLKAIKAESKRNNEWNRKYGPAIDSFVTILNGLEQLNEENRPTSKSDAAGIIARTKLIQEALGKIKLLQEQRKISNVKDVEAAMGLVFQKFEGRLNEQQFTKRLAQQVKDQIAFMKSDMGMKVESEFVDAQTPALPFGPEKDAHGKPVSVKERVAKGKEIINERLKHGGFRKPVQSAESLKSMEDVLKMRGRLSEAERVCPAPSVLEERMKQKQEALHALQQQMADAQQALRDSQQGFDRNVGNVIDHSRVREQGLQAQRDGRIAAANQALQAEKDRIQKLPTERADLDNRIKEDTRKIKELVSKNFDVSSVMPEQPKSTGDYDSRPFQFKGKDNVVVPHDQKMIEEQVHDLIAKDIIGMQDFLYTEDASGNGTLTNPSLNTAKDISGMFKSVDSYFKNLRDTTKEKKLANGSLALNPTIGKQVKDLPLKELYHLAKDLKENERQLADKVKEIARKDSDSVAADRAHSSALASANEDYRKASQNRFVDGLKGIGRNFASSAPVSMNTLAKIKVLEPKLAKAEKEEKAIRGCYNSRLAADKTVERMHAIPMQDSKAQSHFGESAIKAYSEITKQEGTAPGVK